MNARLIFGLSAMLSLLSFGVIAGLYVLPWLRAQERNRALAALVVPHLFLRFIGLSFLIVGVVSPALPAAFAVPAAYGDLIAGILAIVAVIALNRGVRWANGSVWLFNIWGTADLLFAFYQGPRLVSTPGDFGAAYFLPTLIVPALLVMHFLIFKLLLATRDTVEFHKQNSDYPIQSSRGPLVENH